MGIEKDKFLYSCVDCEKVHDDFSGSMSCCMVEKIKCEILGCFAWSIFKLTPLDKKAMMLCGHHTTKQMVMYDSIEIEDIK